MDIIKTATTLTADLLDLFDRTAKRLESPGRGIDRANVLGAMGEVSTSIEKGKQGEVAVVPSGALQHYPARVSQPDAHFLKGTKERVTDVGTNLLYVEPYQQERTEVPHLEIIEPKDQ